MSRPHFSSLVNTSWFLIFSLTLSLFLTFKATQASALNSAGFRAGLLGGNVSLHGNLGAQSSNALGAGAYLGAATSSRSYIDLFYLTSSHTGVRHSELNVGGTFLLESYESLWPSLLGGVTFIGNTLDDNGGTVASNGFGLYFGFGVDYEISKRSALGILAKYTKAFETSARLSSGATVRSIDDSTMVMLRLLFEFDIGD